MSGFGTAITATIGADVAPLNAAGPQIDNAVGKLAGGVEHRLIGSREVATALGTSLGLSLEKMAGSVASFVFGVTEEAKKAYQGLADTAERITEAYERQFALRRGEAQAAVAAEQQLASLQKQAIALKEEEATWTEKLAKIQQSAAANSYIGNRLQIAATNEIAAVQAKLAANALAQQKAGADLEAANFKARKEALDLEQQAFEKSLKRLPVEQQLNSLREREKEQQAAINAFKGAGVLLDGQKAELLKTQSAIQDALNKQAEDGNRRALEIVQETEDYVKAHREELELEAKYLSGRILPDEKTRLDILRLQNKEKQVQYNIDQLLSVPAKERTQANKEELNSLFSQSTQINKQIDEKKKILAVTKEQVTAEGEVAAKIDEATAGWVRFSDTIGSFGRGDKDLSDRELARKIQTIKADIFQRQLNEQHNGYQDFFLNPQKSNLTQALAEQNLRTTVRRDASAFGQDRAFAMHGALDEQRFADILKTATDSQAVVSELKTLNRNFATGQARVVSISGDRPSAA